MTRRLRETITAIAASATLALLCGGPAEAATAPVSNPGSWDYPAGSSRQRLLSRISMRAVRPAEHIAAGREVRYRG
jgi:hypothetical protein